MGTPQLTDDHVIDLGTTGVTGDRLKVRGAEPGDRLCALAAGANPWIGCQTLDTLVTSLFLQQEPAWSPDIRVTPVSSRTFNIRVTQALAAGESLFVQLIPAYELTPTTQLSPWAAMTSVGGDEHQATLTAEFPVFAGYLRAWISGTDKEAIVPNYLGERWGARSRGW